MSTDDLQWASKKRRVLEQRLSEARGQNEKLRAEHLAAALMTGDRRYRTLRSIEQRIGEAEEHRDKLDRELQKLASTEPIRHTNPPSPITPLKGSWRRSTPKSTQIPDLPPNYPSDLKPATDVIICIGRKKFPLQTQIVQLCKYVITKLTPRFRKAISEKVLRQDMALAEMGELLHYILVPNCNSDSIRYELRNEVKKSEEWLKFARAIARPLPINIAHGSAPTNDGSNPSASQARARNVIRVIDELTILKPKMFSEDDYDGLKQEYPKYLAFTVCDRHKDLKRKLENIQGHQQFKRLAKEIVARNFSCEYSTVERDWKTHNPDRKSRRA